MKQNYYELNETDIFYLLDEISKFYWDKYGKNEDKVIQDYIGHLSDIFYAIQGEFKDKSVNEVNIKVTRNKRSDI